MIKNAKIKSTMLGREDHGIMTCMLHLDYGGSGQGFGGYSFGEGSKGYGIKFILGIIDTVGVMTWEELPGKFIRVKTDEGKIVEIGNVIEDKWFDPRKIT